MTLKAVYRTNAYLTSTSIPIPSNASSCIFDCDMEGDVSWTMTRNEDDWIPIANGDSLSLGSIGRGVVKKLGMIAGRSPSTYLDPDMSSSGTPVYGIGAIDILATDIRLFRGANAWKEETWSLSGARTGIPEMSWILERKPDTTGFLPIDMSFRDYVWRNASSIEPSYRRSAITLWCGRQTTLACKVTSNHPMAVYVNGNRVFSYDPAVATARREMNVPLRADTEGSNRIEILMNVNSGAKPLSLKLGLDPIKTGYACYGDAMAMTQCSLFDLTRNSLVSDSHFSFRDMNGEKRILVLDPTTGVDYWAIHQTSESMKSSLRIRATLLGNRQDGSNTPRIRGFGLQFLRGE
jgi:hypothetical protein